MTASTLPLSPSRPLSTLAIAGRAGHAFTPHAMMQGFVCHARGVELAAAGPARVHARVRSKRVHDVLLRADHGRLTIACTCPARSLGLDFCKHAWAALLEVDRQDALGELRSSFGPLAVDVAVPAVESVVEETKSPPPSDEKKKESKAAKVKQRSARATDREPPATRRARDERPASRRSARATAAPRAARGKRPRPQRRS